MTDQERYQKEKESHEDFIRGYKACIRDAERFATKIEGFGLFPKLLKMLESEGSMRESCDAPNAPGYYRANND